MAQKQTKNAKHRKLLSESNLFMRSLHSIFIAIPFKFGKFFSLFLLRWCSCDIYFFPVHAYELLDACMA